MQIREIHIDSFGSFSDRRFLDVRPGLNVIYGRNEFGKTTLLEFVRWVLFGLDRGQGKDFYAPVSGGARTGSLVLESLTGEKVHIARQGATLEGQVTVRLGDREVKEDGEIGRLLGHASRKVFRNIYAFTLEELQKFDSLMEAEIKDKILGAGLGLGPVSLAGIREGLEKRKSDLFSGRKNAKKDIDLLGEALKALEKRRMELQEQSGQYSTLERRHSELLESNRHLHLQIAQWRQKKHVLERDRDLYPNFIALEEAEEGLNRAEPVSEFPEGAFDTVHTLKQKLEDLTLRLEETKAEVLELHSRFDKTRVDKKLLERSTEIKRLDQMTESIRSALRDIPVIQSQLDAVNLEIERELPRLGPDWDRDRARDFVLNTRDRRWITECIYNFELIQQKIRDLKMKQEHHQEQQAATASARPVLPGWLGGTVWGMVALGLAGLAGGWLLMNPGVMLLAGIVLVIGVGLRVALIKNPTKDFHTDSLESHYREQRESAQREEQQFLEEWQDWLRQRDLDSGLTPEGIKDWEAALREIQGKLSHGENLESRLAHMGKTIDEAHQKFNQLKEGLEGVRWLGEILPDIQTLAELWEDHKKAQVHAQELVDQVESRRVKIKMLEEQCRACDQEIQGQFQSVGASDEADFIRKHGIWERRRDLLQAHRENKETIQSKVGRGKTFDEFIQVMRSRPRDNLEAEWTEVQGMLQDLEQKKESSDREIGSVYQSLQDLNKEDALLDLQREMEEHRERLNRRAREWAVASLALEMLTETKRKYERDHKPQVTQFAEAYFRFITEGAYERIVQPLDQETLYIEDAHSGKKGLGELSRGTREQLYLAMRLGVIKEYETRSEPLPILMDDVFVNFDDERRHRMGETLNEFAQGRQVIVLACHRHTLELLTGLGAHALEC